MYGSRFTFTPWERVSLVSGIDVMDIRQRITETQTVNRQNLKQDKYTAGIVLRPFKDFSISTDYSIKQLQQNQAEFTGHSAKATVLYNPLNFENFNLDINISQTNAWGFGFNDLERENLLQTSGAVQDFQIRNRNDSVLLASIVLSLDIELDSFRYMEKLIVSGEAYVKRITDEINPENEFEISGMLLKTSIML